MAKAADKKQKAQQQQADDLEAALAAAMASDEIDLDLDVEPETAPVLAPEPVPEPAPVRAARKEPVNVSNFDISAYASSGENVQRRFGAFADTFESLRRDWQALDAQLVSSRDEMVRLQAIELDRGRLANELDEFRATVARLERDLSTSRAEAVAATERATKFEEICESIKERAFELHTALQDVQAKEEKNIAELETTRKQLAEASRRAQDEGVSRVAAEERVKELEAALKRFEADDAVIRERMAKLVEDNKTITSQVPALLSDRERLQKQFAASERENARLTAERQTLSDRVRGLDDEVRTLRADLGSFSAPALAAAPARRAEPAAEAPRTETPKATAAPAKPAPQPEPAPVDSLLTDEDFDLEASLERVFSAEMANAGKGVKH